MAYTREDYDWFKAHGICPSCGKRRPAPNRVECDICIEKHIHYRNNLPPDVKAIRMAERREYQRQLRAARKAAGLCMRCGRPLGRYATTVECDFCRTESRNRSKLYRPNNHYAERGVCLWCGAERVPGKKFCPVHLAQKTETALRNKGSNANHPWRKEFAARIKIRGTENG